MVPVRLRVEIERARSREVIVLIALVNTGFTSEGPDTLVPASVARALGLVLNRADPCPSYLAQRMARLGAAWCHVQRRLGFLTTDDRVSEAVLANVIVDPLAEEVLISDALAEELGIQILYPRRGVWKFAEEDRVRHGVEDR
jgi:hypothetical protein